MNGQQQVSVFGKYGFRRRRWFVVSDFKTGFQTVVRLRQWAAQIQECQSRPADMKVETWCSEHGITKANYYYRLRRVRKACLEACNPEPAFVELPMPAAETIPSVDSCGVKPAAVLRNSRGLALEIYNHTSADIIRNILEVLAHAE